jgi:hypothetical protein
MPLIVKRGLTLKDVRTRRVRFDSVPTGAVFFSRGRWYQRVSLFTGAYADSIELEKARFKKTTMVQILDEAGITSRRASGMSYEEFVYSTADP